MTTIALTPAQEEALDAALLALGDLSSVPPRHRASLVEVRDILFSHQHPQKRRETITLADVLCLDCGGAGNPIQHKPPCAIGVPESELRAMDGNR